MSCLCISQQKGQTLIYMESREEIEKLQEQKPHKIDRGFHKPHPQAIRTALEKTWTGEEMNYKEYSFTASEITQLEYMLSIMPKDHEIERIGLEYRLEKARQKLEGVPIPTKPKSIHVNFQGEPVVDGESIDANFAGKATTAFAESTAITTAGAAGQLRDTGAIPHQGLGRQLVSGITGGSFGFEIELPPPTEDERAQGQTGNPAEKAMVMIQDLLETSLTGTDEELATLTAQMHPRAVRKVTEFLKILKNNGAQVTIEMDGREVGLRNPDEVERAVNRLAEILSSPRKR